MKEAYTKLFIVIAVGLLVLQNSLHILASEEPKEKTQQEIDQLMRQAAKYYEEEQYAEAINLYRQAADHGNAWGQNNIAWLYATFRDPKYRNGKLAVYYALKATEQEPHNSHFFRTLAAAYARNGQFEQAIAAQKKAIELLSEDKVFSEEVKQQLRVDNEKKLELYKNHQAYIDEQ